MQDGTFGPTRAVGLHPKGMTPAFVAVAYLLLSVGGQALAQSGETGGASGAFERVTEVTTADCNTIRNQIVSGFGGDWVFVCYGDETDNPSCGLFSSQTNLLGYCEDKFPNGVTSRTGSPLKTNVQVLGVSGGGTTGVQDFMPSLASVFSNIVCASYNPSPGTPGNPGQQVCVRIDRRLTGDTAASVSQCPSGSTPLFRIDDGDCTTAVQNVVESVAGPGAGTASFAWMTDVGPPPPATAATLGRPNSEGLLICGGHKATCLPDGVTAADFSNVAFRYQIPSATVQEQPDCRVFGGRRYC